MADANRPADPYEAKYMAADALYRDKIKAPLAYHLLLALPALIVLGVTFFVPHAPWILPLIELPFLFFLWLLFSVLRITVTPRELVVQYGLFGPRVPIESIKSAQAVDYDWKQFGGFGIRKGRDGTWAYNMMGDHGRAVRVEYEENGARKKLLVASPNPVALAEAIQKARTNAGVRFDALDAADTKARVAAREDDDDDVALAEEESSAATGDAERDREPRG